MLGVVTLLFVAFGLGVTYGKQTTATSGGQTGSSSATPREPVYLMNLSWSVSPFSFNDKVQPGLAVVAEKRYIYSLTQRFCSDTATIDTSFQGEHYTKFNTLVAVDVPNKMAGIDVRMYIRDTAADTSGWILLESIRVESDRPVSIDVDLPNSANQLRLETSPVCSSPVIWANPTLT